MNASAGKRLLDAFLAAGRSFFTGMLVLFPVCTCIAWLCACVERAFGIEPARQAVVAELFENIAAGRYAATVKLFTAVPLAEELIFRWIPLFCATRIAGSAPEKTRRAVGVQLDIATSAGFAFAHGEPTLFPPLFLLGLAFMRILRLRGLHCSVAAHAGYNFAAVVAAAAMSARG